MMKLTPNGRAVRSRPWAISPGIASGRKADAPITPKPPALETAAARSGPAPVPMPAENIGYSIPRSRQRGVRSPWAMSGIVAYGDPQLRAGWPRLGGPERKNRQAPPVCLRHPWTPGPIRIRFADRMRPRPGCRRPGAAVNLRFCLPSAQIRLISIAFNRKTVIVNAQGGRHDQPTAAGSTGKREPHRDGARAGRPRSGANRTDPVRGQTPDRRSGPAAGAIADRVAG